MFPEQPLTPCPTFSAFSMDVSILGHQKVKVFGLSPADAESGCTTERIQELVEKEANKGEIYKSPLPVILFWT